VPTLIPTKQLVQLSADVEKFNWKSFLALSMINRLTGPNCTTLLQFHRVYQKCLQLLCGTT